MAIHGPYDPNQLGPVRSHGPEHAGAAGKLRQAAKRYRMLLEKGMLVLSELKVCERLRNWKRAIQLQINHNYNAFCE